MALKLVLIVAMAVLAVEARPRYIAIPLQDLRLVRHARSAPTYARRNFAQASQRQPMYEYSQPRYEVAEASERKPVYAREPTYSHAPNNRVPIYSPTRYEVAEASEEVPIYAQPIYDVVQAKDGLVPESSDRYERQSDGYGGGNDHVDYGAYTGGYGAFGWYTDHPVCVNCGGYH